jgi:hypothetical protein
MRQGTPIVGATYHCVTLLGNEEGKILHSCQSTFAGFTETKPQREVREAAPVYPEKMLALLGRIGEPGLLVNNAADLYLYLLLGGHGVIRRELLLTQELLAELVALREVARSPTLGYVSTATAPKEMVRKAPTKKLRYLVLRRDGFRCKVCGRSAEEDVHATIEVHHIDPFGYGGVTTSDNLITLCKTCHDGVHDTVGGKSRPGTATELYPLIGVDPIRDLIDSRPDYRKGVELYRRISRCTLEALEGHGH